MKKLPKPAQRKKQAPEARAKSVPKSSPATKATPRKRHTSTITARKSAEASLQEHETRFQALFTSSIDAILLTIPNGKVLAANPAACRLFERTEDEIKQAGRNGLMDNTDARIEAAIQTRASTGSFFGELTFIRKNGEKIPCEVSSSLFKDREGNVRTSMIIRDISARKKAVLALQESEKRFQQITAAVTDYIYTVRVMDGRARETIHGQGCFAITGYKSDEFTNDPFLWFRMIAEGDRAMVERQARQILLGDEPAPIEHRIVHKNGTLRWVKNTFVPHYDALGVLTSYEGLIQDITERKQTEEALRISEFRWKFAIEGAGDGLWDWDVTTNTVFYSKRWKEMLGYAEDEIQNDLGEWEKRVHPEDKPAILAAAEAHRNGQTPFYKLEHRFLCKDGSWKWILAHGMAVSHDAAGKPLRVIGRHTDITERKQAEESLRQTQQNLELAQKAVHAAIWNWDIMSGRFDWSPELFTMFGLDPNKDKPSIETWQKILHPDDREPASKKLEEAILNQKLLEAEYRIVLPDGQIRWIYATGRVTTNTNGHPIRMSGLCLDSTGRKEAENTLRRSEARLNASQRIAHLGNWELDLITGKLLWSEEIFRILEIDQIHFDATYDAFLAAIHPDDRDAVNSAYTQSLETRQPYEITHRLRMPDGRIKYVHEQCETSFSPEGKPLVSVGTLQDITEQKQIEESMRQKTAFLEAQTSSTIDGILVVDERGRKLLQNQRMGELWKIPPEIAADLDDQIQVQYVVQKTKNPEQFAARITHLYNHPQEISRDEIELTDGTVLDRYSAPVQGLNGQYYGRIWIFRDISARKQAEDALRESEFTLRESQAIAGLGSYATDLTNNTWRSSPVLDQIFEMKPAPVRTMEDWVVCVHPEDQAMMASYFLDHVVGQRQRFDKEYRIIRQNDKAVRWVHGLGRLSFDPEGRPIEMRGTIQDITERKLADEALRLSENQLRAMFELAPIGIAQANPQTRQWLQVNPKMCEITGYTADEMVKLNVSALTHPDDELADREAFQRVLRNEAPAYQTEKRYVRKDGTLAWVNVNVTVLRDATGQPVRSIAMIEDITARKISEEALRTSENRFRGLFDLAVDGILIGASDGTCIETNQQLCVLVGRTRDELLGQKINFLFTPEIIQKIPLRFDLLQQGQTVKTVRPIKRPDGLEVIVEMHSKMMPDGTYQSFFHDVTGQKQAEAALRASEERFRDLLQNVSTVAVQGYRLDGTTSYWNTASEQLYGYTAKEAIGHNLIDLIIPAEMQDGVRQAMQFMAETGQPIPASELSLKRKDGSRVAVFSSHSIVQLPGLPAELFCIDIDLTERKQAEAALLTQTKLHAAELEQRVHERTAELEATNKELEAFSYSVSHDLRAPLRAIDGFSAILNTDFMARLDKEGQRVLGIICAEAKRMGLLIDDLLTFSRMNRLTLQTGEIEMTTLAQTVFDECAASVPTRQLQIKLQPLPTAQGDAPMIRQVLMNLIANAIKYTRPKALAEIEIGGHQDAGENFYYVKDNGVGFNQQYADKLFGVFQRLHTEDEFEGTGVGLALVQRVIHRHGGRVWAEAKVNEGATFHFTIPTKPTTP